VVLRQPLIQTRREQKRLLAIAPQEVPRHDGIVLNPSDGHLHYATASVQSGSEAAWWHDARIRSGSRATRWCSSTHLGDGLTLD
jgi:hypothetical protein